MPCLELLPVFLDNQEQHSNVMIPAFGRLEVIFEHRLLPEPHSLKRPQGGSGRVRSQRYLRLELLQAQPSCSCRPTSALPQWSTPGPRKAAAHQHRMPALPTRPPPVSYTHLTLPTI